MSFSCLGQRTFEIDKAETDSIDLKDYKIFSVSENVDMNSFIGREIPKSKRFRLTREEAVTADKLLKEQYVKASVNAYYKQFQNLSQHEDSAALEKSKQTYKNSYKTIESRAKRDSKKKLLKNDRYFFGYVNSDNERLVLMWFDPQERIKNYPHKIGGEYHMDIIVIHILNLDKKDLSTSGWTNFKED